MNLNGIIFLILVIPGAIVHVLLALILSLFGNNVLRDQLVDLYNKDDESEYRKYGIKLSMYSFIPISLIIYYLVIKELI